MPAWIFQAMGVKQASARFTRMGMAAMDASPAFETIAVMAMRIEAVLFESQGRRGGGSWKRDTPEWLDRKLRLNLDPRINHATLALRGSLTIPDAPGQILEITPQSLRFGSDLPYAQTVQDRRPFIKYTQYDKQQFAEVIRDHLIKAWNAATV